MKTAIYIEDGIVQLVLTPQSKFEREALAGFQPRPGQTLSSTIYEGQFYTCRGGWDRQSAVREFAPIDPNNETDCDRSLILRAETKATQL